jgi:hypothetical protein
MLSQTTMVNAVNIPPGKHGFSFPRRQALTFIQQFRRPPPLPPPPVKLATELLASVAWKANSMNAIGEGHVLTPFAHDSFELAGRACATMYLHHRGESHNNKAQPTNE